MIGISKLLLLIPLIALVSPALADQGNVDRGQVLRVNCDKGRTIAKALRRAEPGDTVRIKGICEERVTIVIDNITLEGIDNAVIDGSFVDPPDQEFNGLVTVDGAQGVTIRGLTVRNSSGQGIFGVHGANMIVQDVSVEGHFVGVELSNSAAELADVSVSDSISQGIDAFTNSTVIFRGSVEVSGSQGAGLLLNSGSTGEIRGGDLKIHDNAIGVVILYNSSLSILAFAASSESTLVSINNLGPGISIAHGMLLAVQLQPSGQMITSSGNGGPGIAMSNQASLESTFPFSKIVIENNPVGIDASVGVTINWAAGLLVRKNSGPGIVMDGSTVSVGSTGDNPSSVKRNNGLGPDVVLAFGTQATFSDVAIAPNSVICDDTVLLRGVPGVTCPWPPVTEEETAGVVE